MKVTITLSLGKSFTLDIESAETVEDLKNKVSLSEKLSSNLRYKNHASSKGAYFDLYHSGTLLKNERTISSYDIQAGTTINAVPRTTTPYASSKLLAMSPLQLLASDECVPSPLNVSAAAPTNCGFYSSPFSKQVISLQDIEACDAPSPRPKPRSITLALPIAHHLRHSSPSSPSSSPSSSPLPRLSSVRPTLRSSLLRNVSPFSPSSPLPDYRKHAKRRLSIDTPPSPPSPILCAIPSVLPLPIPSLPMSPCSSPVCARVPLPVPPTPTIASIPAPSVDHSHCFLDACKKKIGIMGIKCRCGSSYCSKHVQDHKCTFDYRALNKQKLAAENPVIAGQKIQKI